MERVYVDDGDWLAPGPAASYQRARADGMPAGITSAGRTRSQQQHLRRLYLTGRGAFAQPPGLSRHEAGHAVDLPWAAAQWLRDRPEYGWRFTDPNEWWHAEYFVQHDKHLGRTRAPEALTKRKAPDMVIINTGSRYRAVCGDRLIAIDPKDADNFRAGGVPVVNVTPTTFEALRGSLIYEGD